MVIHEITSRQACALLVEAHVVYYQSDDRAVTVLRILHGQLDAAEHLAPSSH